MNVINSMELRLPWEVDNSSTGHETPQLLWNLKVYYCVCNSLSLEPILSQMNQSHTFTFHVFKIHFNIITSAISVFPKWSYPVRFSN